MNDKDLIHQIVKLNELNKLKPTFKVKWEIRRTKRNIDKFIKAACKHQANLMYQQTYEFYSKVVENNLN